MEGNSVSRIFDIIEYQSLNYSRDVAFADKRNGKWETRSTNDVIDLAKHFSCGLLAMGIQPGDKIAMISNNRSEWCIADLAMVQIGVANVPVYPTISEEDYAYIFNHAEVKMVIASDEELYQKVQNVFDQVPSLTNVFTFDTVSGAKNWTEIVETGKANPKDFSDIKNDIKNTDLATIIYTSGTTGKPKGVMLSHQNLVSNVLSCLDRVPVHNGHTAVSFLPVCHVYERMLLYLYQYLGLSIYFAESIDTIGEDLRDVKPQVFSAVPRLLEKVYDKIIAKGEELSGIKRKLFFWAVDLGQEYDVVGKSGWYHFKLKIARKLIFSKWQAALGGNCLAAVSGSAALQPRLARVFIAAGIPIYEGYGLTETSPVVSVNCFTNDGLRIGTVGRVVKDVEVKIAEDGEILVKGPNLMMGYYKQTDLTAEVIDSDGWFHTGDIGEFQEGQYLKITDRKKEMFKTSGGKYVAPQVMENKFKESRFIEQIMVVGENQKFPGALIVPSFDFVREWAKRKEIQVSDDNAVLIKNEQVIERIQREINAYNKNFGNWEQIKKFALCTHEWAVETGELTPTLKLKRKVILAKYSAQISDIYGG